MNADPSPGNPLRPLIERALPSVENPLVAERASNFLVTGSVAAEAYPDRIVPARDFNRLDFAVHAALSLLKHPLAHGACLSLLASHLPPPEQ